MSAEKIIYLALAMMAVVLVIYLLLPRLKGNTPMIVRTVLFFAAILFLGVDFYQKGKFLYIGVLALGSIGFATYIKMYGNNSGKDK